MCQGGEVVHWEVEGTPKGENCQGKREVVTKDVRVECIKTSEGRGKMVK